MRRMTTVVACLCWVSMASADHTPILHEYVPDVRVSEQNLVVSSDGEGIDAIVYQGEVLPAPAAQGLQSGEQPMRAARGNGAGFEEQGRRSPLFRPDRVTNLRGSVRYQSVFTPGVMPFKRVTALDRVSVTRDGVPVLRVTPGRREPIDVVSSESFDDTGEARDRFWGSVLLDFIDGPEVPLPSVSPDSRILMAQTTPQVDLVFERDHADNYVVRAASTWPRRVRLVYIMDAPQRYFGADLSTLPADTLAHRLTPMPASVARRALLFASELGLQRGMPFDHTMQRLVGHFRAFEESAEPPRDRGDIFLDLARGMRGICRHRAYLFVVTAQALGIYARFVQNEAHVWGEVAQPDGTGFLRVDLGGAAAALESEQRSNGPAYRPPREDGFPRPEPYLRAIERARQLASQRAQTVRAPSSWADAVNPRSHSERQSSPEMPETAAEEDGSGLRLRLLDPLPEVVRGRELILRGRALGDGAGVEGLRVEAALVHAETAEEIRLGVTVSNAQGYFEARLGVPPDVQVGRYRLLVRTPGNGQWGATVAR